MTEPYELTATEIVAAIEANELTCEAIAISCVERIESQEGNLRAWGHLDRDAVLAAARAAEPRGQRLNCQNRSCPEPHRVVVHTYLFRCVQVPPF